MITGKTKSVPASIRFLFQYESAAWKLLVSKCCKKITIGDMKGQIQFFIKKITGIVIMIHNLFSEVVKIATSFNSPFAKKLENNRKF